jgi:ABC-type transport system involved in cytochrome c biogenesis permease subunit
VSGAWPLGNMFEFSSVMALVVVVGGLVFVQRRMRRPELMGFVLLGAVLTLALSAQLYAAPGPLQPVLDSWWLSIHVTTISIAFGLLSLATVFAALQLARSTAETRFAGLPDTSSFGAGTVGAAEAPPEDDVDADATLRSIDMRVGKDTGDAGALEVPADLGYAAGLRGVLAQRWLGILFPWRVALVSAGVALAFSLLFTDVTASILFPLGAVAVVALGWWAVPFLPPSSELDKLTYRTTAFAFPILTFAIIAGAIWAEQSWGRYWGWDPKETSAFVTWVAYAGYLHARATRGFKGQRAAWIALGSYGVLLFTYYGVNLVISGLHSYAGL